MNEQSETTDPQEVDAEMERRRLDYQEMEESQYVLGRDVTEQAQPGRVTDETQQRLLNEEVASQSGLGSGGERDLRDFHSECPPEKHDLPGEASIPLPTEEQLDADAFDKAVQEAVEKEKPDSAADVFVRQKFLNPLNAIEFHGAGVGDSFGDTAGFKFDKGKLRYDLIPTEAMKALATILTSGAEKYSDRNWEGGMSWQRVYASLMRHLVAFESGEDLDPESGELHMAHALCNVVFLVTYQMRPHLAEFDDRPKSNNGGSEVGQKQKLEKHPYLNHAPIVGATNPRMG
ncbi:hypothetical protein LCGC14_0423520 [marine sediment metagenome]|uniref:dATP/dGTP diphosphohydrolase N-terminal domain-containing protein n=1 Tax=marine sediment metagenome TaxID=412755 RepID=A0A0F9SWA8_9ZZZZ